MLLLFSPPSLITWSSPLLSSPPLFSTSIFPSFLVVLRLGIFFFVCLFQAARHLLVTFTRTLPSSSFSPTLITSSTRTQAAAVASSSFLLLLPFPLLYFYTHALLILLFLHSFSFARTPPQLLLLFFSVSHSTCPLPLPKSWASAPLHTDFPGHLPVTLGPGLYILLCRPQKFFYPIVKAVWFPRTHMAGRQWASPVATPPSESERRFPGQVGYLLVSSHGTSFFIYFFPGQRQEDYCNQSTGKEMSPPVKR